MRDPLDELDHFTDPGPTMNPLPASEVRRRGTRLRRRNHALAAIGGAAAVAIIATPIALAANRTTSSDPQPVKPSPTVTWVTQIPADFPLTDGLPDGTRVGSKAAPTGITACGTDPGAVASSGAGAGATSGASVSEQGTDGGTETRTLTLYDDDAAAAAATNALEDLVSGCPTDPNGTGAPLVNAVGPGSLGGDASLVVTQQAQIDADLLADLTTMVVVRNGNAVYVVTSHTSAGGPQVVDSETARLTEGSQPVVEAMCAFSADPC
ncbi:hypothetical protein [Nocardioides conyzicola]|uniref:Sensor domain-containing protein n=1 Tax=Nocardioides conyzicola TaxID=1651781 RepID=A0ABP8XPM7_9ACTN